MFKKTKRVFLDYASTTPVDRRVYKAMKPYFRKNFFNPSALYKEGVEVKNELENARKKVANLLQVKSTEVLFTGSGTESDNLGVLGVARRIQRNNPQMQPHIITSTIEHVAVLESCRQLEREGFDVTYLPVDNDGIISVEEFRKALRPETILVSIMSANNEIGTIQPVRQIGIEISKYKKGQKRISTTYPYLHSDASQAANTLNINVDRLNVDLLTLDGSKIYGPKGIGCLIVKSYVPIESILSGGGQERGLRPATEHVANIIGFTRALEIVISVREQEKERLRKLQKYFLDKLEKQIPRAKLNGSRTNRLANNINICIDGINAEFTVIQLDEKGIACAAMTACKNLSGEISSYVIESLKNGCEKSSLRFTTGRKTQKSDIDKTIKALRELAGSQLRE